VDYARAGLPRRLSSQQRREFYLPPNEVLNADEAALAEAEQLARAGKLEEIRELRITGNVVHVVI